MPPIEEKAKRLVRKVLSLFPTPYVLGLQEVESDECLKALCLALGPKWSYLLGNFTSPVTGQRVGMIYDTARVSLDCWDCGATGGVLDKQIWARFLIGDVFYTVVNVHLKASWDTSSVAVRHTQTKPLIDLINSLRERFPNQLVACGDFNDLDTDIETPTKPHIYSGVLQKIKAQTGLTNALCDIPVKNRISNIWNDCIDHCLFDENQSELVFADIFPDSNVSDEILNRTSDHFPLVVQIKPK